MIPFLIESGDCSTTRVLAESDYLLLLLPSTTETRGILDRAALAFLKPGARGY
jgi:phosphoglycerate dehydrogenase-like enzyme